MSSFIYFYKCAQTHIFIILVLILTWEWECQSAKSTSSSKSKRSNPLLSSNKFNHLDKDPHPLPDTNFDFNFNWDKDPPKFISQLDLEVKWEDEEDGEGVTLAPPSRVSIKNVTVNQGVDILDPMTKLITKVANHSFHGVMNNNNENHKEGEDSTGSCTCEEVRSIINNFRAEQLQTTTATPVPPPQSRFHKGDYDDHHDHDHWSNGNGDSNGNGYDNDHRKKRGCKRCKGQKGEPGLTVVGPKGEPGHPGMLPYHLLRPERLKGEKGLPGPRGLPGQCPTTCSPGSGPIPPAIDLRK